jgi:hypothetical protein
LHRLDRARTAALVELRPMIATESALRPQEILIGGNVKGGMVSAHLKWVRDYRGEAALTKLLGTLPVETGMEVRAAVSAEWVSFESLILLDRAIERMFGRGTRLFQRELGRYSAHLNLAATFRPFRSDDLHRFLRCSAILHAQFQDFGSVTYRQTSPKGGEVVHADYPCFSPVYCQSAIGFYEQVIVEHGATPFLVMERTCQCAGDASCTFELAWD